MSPCVSCLDRIRALANHWHALWIIVDATERQARSIGAGLTSFLDKALPDCVIPVIFSPKTKSDLGWDFLGAVQTGRYRDYSEYQEPDATSWPQQLPCPFCDRTFASWQALNAYQRTHSQEKCDRRALTARTHEAS